MTLTGTGTSHGIPVIGCSCKVCTSSDPRDNRMRCSAFIEPYDFVIDTGPEFRIQALRQGIKNISAVFITHSHADHLNGLDDVRIFSHTASVDKSGVYKKESQGEGLPVYADSRTIRDIKKRFDYIFTPVKEGGGKPKINLVDVKGPGVNVKEPGVKKPLFINGLKVLPVPLMHGTLEVTGWLFTEEKNGAKKSIAYLTDVSRIEESSFSLIKENCGTLVHLVIDGLRKEKHSTHFSFEEAMQAAEKLLPEHTWLTHITHNMSHAEIQDYVDEKLPEFKELERIVKNGGSVSPAYDGAVLEV